MATFQTKWSDDPILTGFVQEARESRGIVGLLLGGSRGAHCADDQSDYDLEIVLTNEAYDTRRRAGHRPHVNEQKGNARLDLYYTCPHELDRLAETPGWWTPGYYTVLVLVDKTGEVTRAVQAITTLPPDKARADAACGFDAYLNGFYRSLKAWSHGNELGAHLEAAESIIHLIRALFALDGRWAPYHDRLTRPLRDLDGQGWTLGTLQTTIQAILRTADPQLQQQLEADVEDLMRARGFAHVVESWGDDIPRVKRWKFAERGSGVPQ